MYVGLLTFLLSAAAVVLLIRLFCCTRLPQTGTTGLVTTAIPRLFNCCTIRTAARRLDGGGRGTSSKQDDIILVLAALYTAVRVHSTFHSTATIVLLLVVGGNEARPR